MALIASTRTMIQTPASTARCGLDTVEIARIERLLSETPPDGLRRWFSEREIEDAVTFAKASPFPAPASMTEHLYAA